MRNLVATSIRRWRVPLAPNLSTPKGDDEQIVVSCYDAETRVTYVVTDACNLYGIWDDAPGGDATTLCLEMCLVEPSLACAADGDEKNMRDVTSPDDVIDVEAPDPDSNDTQHSALTSVTKIVGMVFVDDLRGVCVACATGELIVVAPDPDDDGDGDGDSSILTKACVPECVGKVAQGLRAMSWNPDGELLVLATWAGTLILMTKDFRVLAEAPVGGGGGNGVASLSWRGDGQFLASLVSATGKEPSLRVWEREDLAFHATGESLRPQRISSGDLLFGGFEAGDESNETKSEDATRRRLPYSPPLAWQPRGALIAVATVAQNERDDVDSDDTSASESDGGAAPEKKGKENPTKPSKLTPTAASIIFYERNGLRRGGFTLPKFAVSGTTVTSIAWSSDSRRLAVCVCDPEGARASFFPSAGSGGGGEKKSDSRRRDGDGKHQHRDAAHGSAVQIWRRGNGRWYLSKQICFATCEGEKVSCTWDAVAADTLRTCTPSGLIETHVFCDEVCVSSTGTVAVIDGGAVLVTPLAKTVIPPPMAAATVTFPNSVQDVCFSPGRCIGGCVECDSFRDTNNGRLSTHTHARTLAGEHVLALLSDGRLAICSARLHTEWEETAETLMDEDDECEFKSRDFFATDDDVLLVGKIVNPVSGSHNLLEHPGDVARRVAWIDFDTVLLTTERPSDGSCSLVSIKLTKQTVGASAGLSKLAARDAGWHCEVVAVVDLPGCANAIAVAEGEPVACAFVQLQNRGQVSGDSSLNARTEKNDASANSNNVLLASAEVDTNGDFVLEVLPVTWPSGALSTSCVALKALPPVQKAGPPALCGLDGKGTLFCGEKILANEIRSFTTHFGATGTGKQSGDLSMDDSVAAAAANALAWRLWSLGDTPTGNTPTPPPARVVYVTESDELRVFELFEIFDRGDVSAPLDSPFGAQNVDPNFTNNYATAAGGTREGTDNSNDNRAGGHQQNIERKLQQNDAMHVAMRAAMRPRDAGREIDSRTRRVEQGAVLVVAPSGGVELVLQMPRGNLECVAPRFLVLPAVASAVDSDDFALATRICARHRVDFNLIVDRAWPRFLSKAYAFVKHVDDPDIVAEVLECLASGDCTGVGKPYAHLRKPTTAGQSRDGGVSGEETVTPLLDIANRLLAENAEVRIKELARRGLDKDSNDFIDENAETSENDELKLKDPRGKIRLTCAAVAAAVARVSAEADFANQRGGVYEQLDRVVQTMDVSISDIKSNVTNANAETAEQLPSMELEGNCVGTPSRVSAIAWQTSELIAQMASTTVDINGEKVSTVVSTPPKQRAVAGSSTSTTASSRTATSLSGGTLAMMTESVDEGIVDYKSEDGTVRGTGAAGVSSTTQVKQTNLVWSTDTLLTDRWELVMLSTLARSQPPDLAGALSRVRRRRELEIERAKIRDFGDFDELSNPESSESIDSDALLDHLLALEGGKPLFDAAMGTYDLRTAFLVGQKAPGMDPGEYLPELTRLQAIGNESLRKADVDLKLQRFKSAVGNLLRGGDVEKACEIAAERRMFPHALQVAAAKEKEDELANEVDGANDSIASSRLGRGRRVGGATGRAASKNNGGKISTLRAAVAAAYAAQLSDERKHEDAAVVLLSVNDANGAMREYASGGAWRPALALAGRVGLTAEERKKLASEIVDQLEQFEPAAAAVVAERELRDVDRATSLLTVAKKWRDCVSVAYAHGRNDLIDTVIAPAAAESADAIRNSALEAPGRVLKYLERLRKLKQHREALSAALGVTGGNSRYKTGKPGHQNENSDNDDDAESTATLSTLASGVSGFSAYTDRTIGAQTVTTASGTSQSASTVGGRKPKKASRKERRGKKSTGLRAGGPTEEKDLASHLANGGTCADLLMAGALDEIGELTELLVVLGNADDAAKLQHAVGAALAAHAEASAEALNVLAALAETERKNALSAGLPDPNPVTTTNACPCPNCVKSKNKGCLASQSTQWKWAVLRLPKANDDAPF